MSGSSRRPPWDETWLAVARVIAQRSLCVRDKVGAVIVNPHNRIVATGYNSPPAGFIHHDTRCQNWCERALYDGEKPDREYRDCVALHAEANALSVCDRSLRERGTLYVTSDVCWNCAKLIANSGLLRVVIHTGTHLHREPRKSYEFMVECGLAVVVV